MGFKLGSLFDGSGGFPLAGQLCGGIVPAWASEVEPYPIAVTRSQFPQMAHLGDVSKINGAEVEPVDIITFGSPCQDMSIAGKRAGIKHQENGDEETTRSGLFLEAVRIIKEMREATNGRYPTFAVWENVYGAFSSNGGEDFRLVLKELVQIVEPKAAVPPVPRGGGWPYADCYCGDRWSVAYRTFDAQYWGVPQRRRRIYLVLDLRGQRAGKILFERPGLRGDFETVGKARKTIAAGAEGSPGAANFNGAIPYTMKIRSGCEGGEKGALIQEDLIATLSTNNDQYLFTPVVCYDARGNGDGGTCPTITGDHNNRVTDYTTVVCIQGNTMDRNAKRNGCGLNSDVSFTLNSTDRHGVIFAVQNFGGYKESRTTSTLKSRDFKGSTDIVMYADEQSAVGSLTPWDTQSRRVYSEGGIFPTLSAGEKAGQNQQAVFTHYIVRRLTPTECARLQGFPDKWGHLDRKEGFAEEEYRFWMGVRNTHAEINGKATREYTKEQMLTWYNKLHTDSAEYKMWGNGIALPTALYVMQGIAFELSKSQ